MTNAPHRSRTLDFRFARMSAHGDIWCVPASNGTLDALQQVHDRVSQSFKAGDRLIWLGNVLGHGGNGAQAIDEILDFRRRILALPGVMPEDFVWLRGAQEEMLLKLFQLPSAPQPWQAYRWMLDMGLAATLTSYGIDWRGGFAASYGSALYLQRWVEQVKLHIWSKPGHDRYFAQMKRAAITQGGDGDMLFVSAGIDPYKSLDDQGDAFWWGGHGFNAIREAYKPFKRVVRGYDPAHGGLNINCVTASLDDKCGFGGRLVAASFSPCSALSTLLD